jgi:hypothetical protein
LWDSVTDTKHMYEILREYLLKTAGQKILVVFPSVFV